MPIISSFFGIYVRMYFADHAPPHIHVEYQGHEALVAIDDGTILQGTLPKRALAPGEAVVPLIAKSWSKIGACTGTAAAQQNSGSRQ